VSVYLGDSGLVEVKRSGLDDAILASVLNADDVNLARRRFSFDFDPEALLSGDRIEIRTQDGSTLELVAGHNFPDGLWYCHVDESGGVRLYDNFADALNGDLASALPLVQPTRGIPISVRTRDQLYNCVSQMRSWEITTQRESVDITLLGEEFRRNYASGLVSGQGRLTCLWDYKQAICDPMQTANNIEEPHYFAQLLLRVQQGSKFLGRFFVYQGSGADPSVWWESDCVVTNVAFSFAPGQPIDSTVEFITTGPIHLRMGTAPGYMLQESGDVILQETGSPILLEDPT
jgi:hypothetical protein